MMHPPPPVHNPPPLPSYYVNPGLTYAQSPIKKMAKKKKGRNKEDKSDGPEQKD
jgi:hypothetical protein